MENKQKYYLVYKITNKSNNMIYIGCHITTNINDKYMGSGTYIKRAIKKYGLQNFEKSILYTFDNFEDMINKEAELVNSEFIKDDSNYNIIIGGKQGNFVDMVSVKDKYNNYMCVHKTDPRYLSGELISTTTGRVNVKDINNNYFCIDINDERYLAGEFININKGKLTVKDIDGNTSQVSITDPRYLSGELVANSKGMVTVIDKTGKCFNVKITDERYLSGELISILKHNKRKPNTIIVKDKDNNLFIINKSDERYLSGEFQYFWKGRKHSEKTIEKMKQSHKGMGIGTTNSQYGKCWITKDGINKSINKNELNIYMLDGWIKGRKLK